MKQPNWSTISMSIALGTLQKRCWKNNKMVSVVFGVSFKLTAMWPNMTMVLAWTKDESLDNDGHRCRDHSERRKGSSIPTYNTLVWYVHNYSIRFLTRSTSPQRIADSITRLQELEHSPDRSHKLRAKTCRDFRSPSPAIFRTAMFHRRRNVYSLTQAHIFEWTQVAPNTYIHTHGQTSKRNKY